MIYYLRLIFLILFLAGANSMVFGQCTTSVAGPFPTATFTPQCNQSKNIPPTNTTVAQQLKTYQYSNIYVIAGYQYNFRSLSVGSAVQTDFITIANGTTPLFSGLNGTSGIYWTATLTGVIRFYTHTSAGCPTASILRSREVIMAPFQAKLSVINSLCSGNPGTGQYTVTVGPNHGWNYTSLISPLNAFTSAAVPAAGTIGTFAPRSYDIKLNGTSVNGNASTASNPEICPNCPGLITNGTATWTEAAPLPPPYPGYTYISVTPIATAGTNTFTPTNTQTQTGIGTYTSPATIAGNNGSNQLIAVIPSGSISNLAAYNLGCGPYYFYPTITAPPNLLFNQSGTTTYSCGSGSIALSANGGTAPYNISWFNQASSTIVTSPAGNEISASGGSYTIPNLLAGTYTLTLTDANGCVKTILALIINPPPAPGTPIASVSAQPTCSTPTGTITVTSPVAASGTSYTLTGTNPVVAAITNTTGIFPNLASGIYQVISTAGGCASPPLTGLVVSAITLPALPTVVVSPATCSSNGTASISNYDVTQTYLFTPPGPTIDALGLISGMTAGISYTVTSNIGACASSSSIAFIVDPQLITPPDPTISTAAATCSSVGTAVISNYVSGQTYVFTPIGPTVGAGGGISGMTAGTSYTVTSSNGFCTSLNSLAFSIEFQLITPPAPIIATTAATCFSNGTATISNYVVGQIYDFTPIGPTVGTLGEINSLAVGTIYTVTSSNGFCISAGTSFIISAQLITPEVPVIITEAATCLSVGLATISNYVVGQTYVFSPSGPSVNSSGLISNMIAGISYTVTSNNGSCTSLNSAAFSIDFQLITPPAPTIIIVAPTCLANGTATISNFVAGNTYNFTPSGPTVDIITGVISNMITGSPYTVTSNNGSCTSLDSAPFTIDIQLSTPVAPLVDTTATTCLSDGTATISNYDNTLNYTFTPSGPTVDASGAIINITAGIAYTVTSFNGSCTSLDSAPFTLDFQLITPTSPLVDTTAATCLSEGTATISNYDNTLIYTFTPSGPTEDITTGVISNITAGTTYTVTSYNGFCTSLDSAPFTIDIQLSTPATPIIDTTAATCLSDGTATVSNYDNTLNYTFTPSGPTVDVTTGVISNLTASTSFTLKSANASCSSLDSAPFIIDIQLITSAAPLIDTTAATCLLDGTATLSNYDNTLNYTFTPSGPTLDVTTGVITNMTTGSPYTITSNNGFCSIDSAPFTIDIQLITPADPTFATLAETCLSDEIATISNYDNTLIYTFNPSGPTIDAIGLISNITSGTSFTIISTNGFCISALVPLTVQPLLGNFNVIVDTTICSSNLPFSMNSLTFSAAGTQVANLIAANGCDSLVTINLTVIANDNSNFSQISPICFGDPLALPTSSLNGFSGTWSPAINNTDTTTYTFTPGIGQCGYTATMTIIVYPQVLVTITDTSICTGGTAILIATASPAGGDFFWSNANPTSSITVSPTFSTSYSVFYTSLNNCFATATRLLAVNPIPTATATSALICDGEIATIVATGLPTGGTYLWSPSGQTTASINVSPSSTANYSVVYSRLGCESPVVNTVVTVNPVPILNLASEVICIGEDITMTAQTTIAGGVYDWGNGNSNATQTFSPQSDTTLTLSYSVNGCTSPIETSTITVNPLPISTFSGSPLTGCIPLEVTLLADDNSNTSYSWSASNGLTGTGAQSSLTFTSGGVYNITLTAGLNGCFTTTTLNNYIEVDNYPIASFVPSSNSFTELSQLLEFTNTSSGANSYSWDFGDGASSTEINPEHNFTDNSNGHTITLVAASTMGCTSTYQISIDFNEVLIYYIPNTFTPDGDGHNQTFKPVFTSGFDPFNYEMLIYNRWGEIIFETHDVTYGWDGTYAQANYTCQDGVYLYTIIFKNPLVDERKVVCGSVTLLK
jgi:gliding motility-associated-like protein